MAKKQLTLLLAAIMIVLMLAAGVSALVFDKKDVDDVKSTVSLMTGLTSPKQTDEDKQEKKDSEVEVEVEDDDADADEDEDQLAVDAASSASQKSTSESVSMDAGSVNGITASTSQSTVDAASSASIKSPVVTSPDVVSSPAADSGTSGTGVTQPAVDAIASASLPEPGTTAPTTTDSTASTTGDVRLITETDARNIAISAVGSAAYVKEVEFELDDYPPVYEVKLFYAGKELKIEVHAVTGAILQVESDEEDEDD